ncbi:MAG: HAD hydrolase-like protein [Lachnospiraceae bacterium]|nr:HAD hydrolase-like protein [Lachnospiraceae bacterium]
MSTKTDGEKAIKAVLWDMDGTLFNTKPGIERAVGETLEIKGFPALEPGVIDNFIGPPIQYGFRDHLGISGEEAAKFADLFRELYREKGYVELCDPYDGLKETLMKLKDDGLPEGVCTLKKQDMAERIVRRYALESVFDSIVGTDAKDNIKKDDTIRMSCERFGIDTAEAVLIGDTCYDSEGAEKAGCLFIGVTYGFGFKTRSDVDEYPNIGTAASPADVYEIITAYQKKA